MSTAGGVVGTIATSFWLIPLFALEPLIVWTGMVLCVTALTSLLLRDGDRGASRSAIRTPGARPYRATRWLTAALAAAAVMLGGWVLVDVAALPSSNEFGERVLFRTDTQYHRITVTEDDTTHHLRFDRSHQSAVLLADYESAMRYPEMRVDSVEVDPAVEESRSRLFRSLYRTVGSVWKHQWVFPIGLGDDGSLTANRNIILLATDTALTRDVFERRIRGVRCARLAKYS